MTEQGSIQNIGNNISYSIEITIFPDLKMFDRSVFFFGSEYLKGYALCRRPLLASRGCHLGAWCLHSGTLGNHLEHPGGPWEQQDGLDRGRHRIFNDLGLMLASFFESLLSTEARNFNLCSGLVPGHFLCRFLNRHLYAWGF